MGLVPDVAFLGGHPGESIICAVWCPVMEYNTQALRRQGVTCSIVANVTKQVRSIVANVFTEEVRSKGFLMLVFAGFGPRRV